MGFYFKMLGLGAVVVLALVVEGVVWGALGAIFAFALTRLGVYNVVYVAAISCGVLKMCHLLWTTICEVVLEARRQRSKGTL